MLDVLTKKNPMYDTDNQVQSLFFVMEDIGLTWSNGSFNFY